MRWCCGGARPGRSPSGSRLPLHQVNIKIQKKKTVTKKVHIFTDKVCDPYVTDQSTRQRGRPMTYKTKIFRYKAKLWS